MAYSKEAGAALHMPQLPKRFHAAPFILRATSALGDRGGSQFDDDLRNRRCAGIDGSCAGYATETAIAGAAATVEIEVWEWNPFQFEIFPNIEFGPIQERMHAHMGTGGKRRLVLIPEFGWLVAKVPFPMFIAEREVAFLRPRAFLVRANTEDDRRPPMLRNGQLERFNLQRRAATVWFMPAANASVFWPTIRSSRHSRAIRSRYSINSGIS